MARKLYKDDSGKSGVTFYEVTPNAITIWFAEGEAYKYSYKKPGRSHVEKMKKLAESGSGLATYVNQHVQGNYEK